MQRSAARWARWPDGQRGLENCEGNPSARQCVRLGATAARADAAADRDVSSGAIYCKEGKRGQVAAAFLVGYGVFRFLSEYVREPDAFLGLLAMRWSMGR